MSVLNVMALALIFIGFAITARTDRQREIVQIGLLLTGVFLVLVVAGV